MALATKCPHCNTVFRVAHDQLKLRGGIVRCGSCNEVFDGNAALLAPPAAAPLPAAPAAASVAPPVAAPVIAPAALPTPAPAAPEHSTDADEAASPLAGLPVLPVDDGHEAASEPEPEPEAAPLTPAPAPAPEPTPAPLPQLSPFDAKMEALDTRAAEVLQDEPADTETPLELDTAVDLDNGAALATPELHAAAADVIADPLELPPAPANLPAASELPLELDLDIESDIAPATPMAPAEQAPVEPELMLDLEPEPEPEPYLDPEPEPEPEAQPEAVIEPTSPALDDQLAIETMSDAELEAALAAELAVMERSIGAPAEASGDAHKAGNTSERIEPSFDAPLRQEPSLGAPTAAASALHALDDDDDTLVELSSASKQAAGQPAFAQAGADADLLLQPARTTEAAADADPMASEEPGFLKRDRRRQKYGKAVSIAMALGSVALVGALGVQGVTTFRNQLAAAMPPLKPALTAACNALGCKIELPAQIDDLNIEQGELQTLSDTTFSFNTLLRNQSATAQSWPHIELVLDDASDKAVLRRVFTPRDYLGPDVPLDKGFAPHTEQAVKLFFELNQLKASGYHIAVFYP